MAEASERPAPGFVLEHFIPSNVCDHLYISGHISAATLLLLTTHARTPRQLQAYAAWAKQRALEPAWIEKEANLRVKKQLDSRHSFRGYAPTCQHCGLTALEARRRNMEIECPDRQYLKVDWA